MTSPTFFYVDSHWPPLPRIPSSIALGWLAFELWLKVTDFHDIWHFDVESWGLPEGILKRYRIFFCNSLIGNFLLYMMVPFSWSCVQYPRSSSGPENFVSLKNVKKVEVFKGCQSNGYTWDHKFLHVDSPLLALHFRPINCCSSINNLGAMGEKLEKKSILGAKMTLTSHFCQVPEWQPYILGKKPEFILEP